MKISKKEILGKLQTAYEMEEVMADLLTKLALPHILTGEIPDQEKRKVYKMLSLIHKDTLSHKEIVSAMIRHLSGGSFGIESGS